MATDPTILLQAGRSVPDVAAALQRGVQTGDMLSQMLEQRRNRPVARERAQLENQMLEAHLAKQQQMNQMGMGAVDGMTNDQKNLIQYQQLLKTDPALAEKFGKQTGIIRRDPRAQITSDQSNFAQWKRMVEEDNSLADEFGRAAGFISKEGQEIKSNVSARIFEATDRFNESQSSVNQLNNIANDFDRLDPRAGIVGKWSEKFVGITGQEDAVTELRKRYQKIRNSQALKDLPPGPATDLDVAMVLKPFPEETANPKLIASFLRGLAKIEALQADKSQFEAEFLSTHGSPRTKEGVSMLRAYKDSGRRQNILDTLFAPKGSEAGKDAFLNPAQPAQPSTPAAESSIIQSIRFIRFK